jgi:hypothetical protein|eukprot:6775724-Prymnesium_polylepis.3
MDLWAHAICNRVQHLRWQLAEDGSRLDRAHFLIAFGLRLRLNHLEVVDARERGEIAICEGDDVCRALRGRHAKWLNRTRPRCLSPHGGSGLRGHLLTFSCDSRASSPKESPACLTASTLPCDSTCTRRKKTQTCGKSKRQARGQPNFVGTVGQDPNTRTPAICPSTRCRICLLRRQLELESGWPALIGTACGPQTVRNRSHPARRRSASCGPPEQHDRSPAVCASHVASAAR